MVVSKTRIRSIAAMGVGLYATLACASDSGDPEVAAGLALYEENCLQCHGEDARGGGPLAATLPVQPPNILEHLTHHTTAQLLGLIGGGVPPAMPPQPLSEDEIRLVVDYVWTLVPEPERAALRALQQETERGGSMPGMGSPGLPDEAVEYEFVGTVQRVDAASQTVAVLNEDIPGWMGQMTMTYVLDEPEVVRSLEVGDRITARVYAGDFRTLYGVEVMPE